MRAGHQVDAGVLVLQAVAGIAHDQTIDRDVGRGDRDRIAAQFTGDGGAADAAQGQRFADSQIPFVAALCDTDLVAIARGVDGLLYRLSGVHVDHGCAGRACAKREPEQPESDAIDHAESCPPVAASETGTIGM